MILVRSDFAGRTMIGVFALASVFVVGTLSVGQAADLNPYAYKPGSPYNDRDPRYAELYGPDDHYDKHRSRNKKYDHRRTDDYRDDRHKPRHHKPYKYSDSRDRYDLYRDPRSYRADRTYDRDRYDRYERRNTGQWYGRFALAPHCAPRRIVMRRLFRNGWHDFHGLELHGPKAHVRARSDDGRLFALTIERCSGEIVAARQVEYRHTNGRYDRRAYSEVPYRYDSYK